MSRRTGFLRGTRDPGIVLRRIRIEVCLDTLSSEVGTALGKVRVSERVFILGERER